MPRPVRLFDLFWGDRDFKKTFKRLPEPDQEERLKEVIRRNRQNLADDCPE